MSGRLFVVVPFLDEASGITPTLVALAGQTDADFAVIFVDNGSRDDTRAVIADFAAQHPALHMEVLDEPEKGTGAAADSGFRRAIQRGAWAIARTDADCLPAPDWIAATKRALRERGLEFVAGAIKPRDDDYRLGIRDRLLIPALVAVAAWFGTVRPGNRGPQYRTGYMMAAGNNLAILAETYARILNEAESAGPDRDAQIERARRAWSQGFVAEAIDTFCRTQEIMDVSGRIVKRLTTGLLHAGAQSIEWDGRTDRGLPGLSGLYLVRARCGRETSTAKVLLLR